MFNVAKIIRVLGYIVYAILWSPVILVGSVLIPIVGFGLTIRNGKSLKNAAHNYGMVVKDSVAHDISFLKTGVWE